jgi:hypothetical protein
MNESTYNLFLDPLCDQGGDFEFRLDVFLTDAEHTTKLNERLTIEEDKSNHLKVLMALVSSGEIDPTDTTVFDAHGKFNRTVFGMENLEVVEMITNFIKKIFSTIYKFLSNILKTIERLIKSIINVDRHMKVVADKAQTELKELLKSSSQTEVATAQEKFKKTLILQMCPKAEFLGMISDFSNICQILNDGAHSTIGTSIQELSKKRSVYDIPWKTNRLIAQADRLGITITDTTTKYASPFQKYPEASMESLQYRSFRDVLEIDQKYVKDLWVGYTTLQKIVGKIDNHKSRLQRKEKELIKYQDIDKSVLTDNIKFVQSQIALCISLFGSIKQSQTTLSYRRRRLLETAVKSFAKV